VQETNATKKELKI